MFIPEVATADESAWLRLEDIVTGALAARPPAIRRQVLMFIRILDGMSMLRHRCGIDRLDLSTRTRLIERVAHSRLLLFRRGVWGLRTLVQMGWYSQPEVQRALGYRASPAGWEALR